MIELNPIELIIFGVLCLVGGIMGLKAIVWAWNRISDYMDGTEKQIWGYKSQSKWQDMRLQARSGTLSKTARLGKGGRDS